MDDGKLGRRRTKDTEKVAETAGRPEVKVAEARAEIKVEVKKGRRNMEERKGENRNSGLMTRHLRGRNGALKRSRRRKRHRGDAEKIMAEELEEIMGKTPIERVWRAFDEVEEIEKEEEVREEAEQQEWEKERGIRVELATVENEKTAEQISLERKGRCEQ